MIAFNTNAGDKKFFRKQIFRETFKQFVHFVLLGNMKKKITFF